MSRPMARMAPMTASIGSQYSRQGAPRRQTRVKTLLQARGGERQSEPTAKTLGEAPSARRGAAQLVGLEDESALLGPADQALLECQPSADCAIDGAEQARSLADREAAADD